MRRAGRKTRRGCPNACLLIAYKDRGRTLVEKDGEFYPDSYTGNPPARLKTQKDARDFLRSVGCRFDNTELLDRPYFVSRDNGHVYEVDKVVVPWDDEDAE